MASLPLTVWFVDLDIRTKFIETYDGISTSKCYQQYFMKQNIVRDHILYTYFIRTDILDKLMNKWLKTLIK